MKQNEEATRKRLRNTKVKKNDDGRRMCYTLCAQRLFTNLRRTVRRARLTFNSSTHLLELFAEVTPQQPISLRLGGFGNPHDTANRQSSPEYLKSCRFTQRRLRIFQAHRFEIERLSTATDLVDLPPLRSFLGEFLRSRPLIPVPSTTLIPDLTECHSLPNQVHDQLPTSNIHEALSCHLTQSIHK